MPIKTKDELLKHAQEHGLRRALVVTALALEMRSVRAHLTALGSVQGRYGTIYECGQFSAEGHDWFVVVVESGAGTHPAHAVVTSAQIDFSDFELMIFVGIAASRKAEAPIGSVVASNFLYFPSVGKFDPERGHTGRPRPLNVDRRLVGLAQKVERDAEWPARIRDPLRSTLPTRNDDHYPKPFPPLAFIAPIASLDAVSADPNSELETHIAIHYSDTLAIEMEGYGAAYGADLEETPLIVIRGISDMRSGKTPETDAIHQPVAAAHASAFAFELLNLWGQFGRQEPARTPQLRESIPAEPRPTEVGNEPQSPQTNNGSPATQNVLVLNFAGTAADFPEDKVDQILEALRAISNNPKLALVRTEAGSFRMLLLVTPEDRRKIEAPETYSILLRNHSAKLIGILDEEEYRAAQTLEDALRYASRDLLEWPQNLPDGTHIARPEFNQLLSIIEENDRSTIALLGPPGSGKSSLLASVGKELIARGVPILAIKADLLDPSIQTKTDLQAALSLPTSPSSLLVEISRLRPVVLVIDQLDALAGYVDLSTDRLSVLLNLVRQLGDRKNIHILLSSRAFEFEHDTRLKAVRADSVALSLPAWSTVLPVLEGIGIQAAGWPVDAQDLMRSPQTLSTYLKLTDKGKETPFRTYQSMLDKLWREQILTTANGPRLAKLAGMIAENMAEKETLWLAAARFDGQANDLRSLIASGILTDYEGTGSRVGFSHQTVFEHALARAFAQGEGKLSSYILERQSSLFVRPKLWAALTYLRDVEPSTYESELTALWSTRELRLHLRHMLIEFMGQQVSPINLEAKLFERALSSDQRRVALLSMAGSAGWLKLFESTHVSKAMQDKDETGVAFNILNSAWAFAFDTVVVLVKRHWLPDASLDNYIWNLLQNCPIWTDEVTSLTEEIVERAGVAPHAFDYLMSTIGVEQPEVALKLIATRLRILLREAIKTSEGRNVERPTEASVTELMAWQHTYSQEKPLTDVIEQRDGWEGLEALAKATPALFLQYIWPWFQEALAALRRIKEDDERLGFPIPWGLDLKFPEEDAHGLEEPPLLGALTAALEVFAHEDQSAFMDWLSKHEREDATPAQRLFANALASQPEQYAERAARFLLDDKNRFHLGSIHDSSSTTKRLVKATSPFWSSATLDTFVGEVLAYKPAMPSDLRGKSKQHFSNALRLIKFEILCSLPEERLSKNARRFIAEEYRRFPGDARSSGIHGGFIGSPISAQSLSLASDEDVVNAFRKVPDTTGWDHPKQWMKGGNIQLSREFAESAKTDPERAVRIIEQFEPSFGTRAAGYALDAMAENASPELIISLIEKLNQRGFTGGEFRRSAANAIQRLMQRDISINESILEMLKAWLSEGEAAAAVEGEKDEDEDQLAEGDTSEENKKEKKNEESKGSILWGHGGISVLPHGNFPVLETISRVLLDRKDPDGLLALYGKHLATDEEPNVWRTLLRFVRFIHPTNIADLSDFLTRLFNKHPQIATTYDALVMLAYLHWRLPDLVRQTVTPWKGSATRRLQQAYGELITLIALVQPELGWPQPLLDEITSAKDMNSARLGAAYAAINIWPEAKQRGPISKLLATLIPIADKATWSAIFDLFRLVDEVTPEPEWVSLLEVISENISNVRGVNSTFVVERLQTLLPHQAPLVAKLARGLVDGWRDELGDTRTATAFAARELVDLAITLHRLGPDTRELGTSLFEDLLLINAYTARETLDEIDNRFRATPRSARRRLPRRSRRNHRQSKSS